MDGKSPQLMSCGPVTPDFEDESEEDDDADEFFVAAAAGRGGGARNGITLRLYSGRFYATQGHDILRTCRPIKS